MDTKKKEERRDFMRGFTRISFSVILIFLVFPGNVCALAPGLEINPDYTAEFLNPDFSIGARVYVEIDYDYIAGEGTYKYQVEAVDFRPEGVTGVAAINRFFLPIGFPDPDKPGEFVHVIQAGADNTVEFKTIDDVYMIELEFGPLVDVSPGFPIPPIWGPRGLKDDEWSDILEIYTSFEPGEALATLLDGGGSINNTVWTGVIGPGGGAGEVPSEPPVADAGLDQSVEQESNDGTRVTLDGSGSTDTDSTPGTNDDIIFFDWYEGDTFLGSGETIHSTFALGEHIVNLWVTDTNGETDYDEVIIHVQDNTRPEISVSVTPDSLWPPNHKMVPIEVSITATDNFDPEPMVALTSITMNESDTTNTYDPNYDSSVDDGKTVNDIYVNENGDIYLRAERSGKSNARVYTITYMVTDSSGNSSTASATVTVPHNL